MTLIVPKIAQAVPLNAEDERLVDALVARKMADTHTHPLRKTPDSMRRALYVVGVLAVVILGTAILVWSAFFPHG